MRKNIRRQNLVFPALLVMLVLLLTGMLTYAGADTFYQQIPGRDRWENPGAVLDTLGIRPGMVIGEVGAGTGFFTFLASERVGTSGKVYANDISRRALSTLRSRAGRSDLANIEIIEGDVDRTNFPAAKMDMVVMVYVFHDFTEPLAMMEDIKSSLKPGAPVVIIDADHDRMRDRSQHFLTREQLIEQVEAAGYELIRIHTYLPTDNIYVFRPLTAPVEDPARSLPDHYLGQVPPGNTPVLFAPRIVSTGREHSAAMFNPEGTEIWFGRMFPAEIVFMEWQEGAWLPPRVAPFSGMANDLYPTLTADGNRLFFTSRRPVEALDVPIPRGEGLVWYVDRTPEGWSDPVPMDLIRDTEARPSCVSVAANGNLYFGCRNQADPSRSMDIYRARYVDGHYRAPENLEAINSPTPDHSPFIAPDESYIIWASFRGGYGLSDLFVSHRGGEGHWSVPQNLGPEINTGAKEEYPYITPDGRFLFFNSNRVSELNAARIPDGPGNIYWVDVSIIP